MILMKKMKKDIITYLVRKIKKKMKKMNMNHNINPFHQHDLGSNVITRELDKEEISSSYPLKEESQTQLSAPLLEPNQPIMMEDPFDTWDNNMSLTNTPTMFPAIDDFAINDFSMDETEAAKLWESSKVDHDGDHHQNTTTTANITTTTINTAAIAASSASVSCNNQRIYGRETESSFTKKSHIPLTFLMQKDNLSHRFHPSTLCHPSSSPSLSQRIDLNPFHMEDSFTFSDSSSLKEFLNYQNPNKFMSI
mmetsp:Transcript_19962/g.26019  ORF Transcript_19962/g.26019 Transcript_19962/m.26019 type:complete len:251 (-) Transcript_19962:36-788(-)